MLEVEGETNVTRCATFLLVVSEALPPITL